MLEIVRAVESAINPGTYRCVFGGPHAGAEHVKAVLVRLDSGWQLQLYTETQVFHQGVDFHGARLMAARLLENEFRNMNAWDSQHEHSVKISKKGKVLSSRRKAGDDAPREEKTHNRHKNYILQQGQAIPPLVDMGIFTKDGKVVAAMQDKYRQINRFVELVDDAVRDSGLAEMNVLDFGCGKSYLTFILYHYLTQVRKIKVNMVGLDLKADVIKKCSAAAAKYGYTGLQFQVGDIAGYDFDGKLDMVVTLHACDTATDYALFNAVKWGAGMIFSAPCCQHEINAQMQGGSLPILSRYGLIKERTAALMTDAIRANLLEHCGYRTQILEFIDMEHTPKNILIRAVKQGQPGKKKPLEEVEALCRDFGLEPTLLRLLREGGLA